MSGEADPNNPDHRIHYEEGAVRSFRRRASRRDQAAEANAGAGTDNVQRGRARMRDNP